MCLFPACHFKKRMQFKKLKHKYIIDREANPSLLKRIFNHPVFEHIKILMVFFVSQVALLFADIVTDVLSALEFFSRGHNYWGMFTLVPIFAPFLAKVFITFANFNRCLIVQTRLLWGCKIPGETAIQKVSTYFLSFKLSQTEEFSHLYF